MGSYWFNLLLVVHILVGCAVIGFVLLQHGKGADMGAAFGGGASGSLFGSSGSANFLSRTTSILATAFFATSLALSYFAARTVHQPSAGSVMEGLAAQQSAPVAPAASISVPAESQNQEIPK